MTTEAPEERRPIVLAIWLLVAGALGLLAAFNLTLDKIAVAADPDAVLNCNLSPLVSCGPNLESWQGSLFGFPNPIIGLVCWTAAVAVGFSVLSGSRMSRLYWVTFNVGVVGGLAFVIWLIGQSVYVIGTLCPWCMLTWAVMIPTFWAVTIHNLRVGNFTSSERWRRVGAALTPWVVPITVVCYLVVALLAQLRLDWIHTAF
jgi:uncharacterized membrane protein